MDGDFWAGAEVVYAYTRAQAILDGVLVPTVDLTPDETLFARQAGFLVHVALTRSVADIVIPNEAEQGSGQDVKGRLWDLLNTARFARPRDGGAEWPFKCIFYMADREGYRRGSVTLTLKAHIGPGDDGEPVVTIMRPEED